MDKIWDEYAAVEMIVPGTFVDLQSMVVYFTLKRSWKEIIKDASKPRSELVNEAIGIIADDPDKWNIVNASRPPGKEILKFTHCPDCGDSMETEQCRSCGADLKYLFWGGKKPRGMGCPLPFRLSRRFIGCGWYHTISPVVLRNREQEAFKSTAAKA